MRLPMLIILSAALPVLWRSGASADPPPEVQASPPRVICAENLSPRDGEPTDTHTKDDVDEAQSSKDSPGCRPDVPWTVRLEDVLAIQVAGYRAWAAEAEDKGKHLRVFVEGMELDNLHLRYVGVAPGTQNDVLWTSLRFERDDARAEARETWAQVLRLARRRDQLTLSIGPSGGPQWATTAVISLNSYPTGLSLFAGFVILMLLGALVWAARSTSMLRDNNGACNGPFSLAKHQMAVWFVLVVSAFLFVTMTTGAAAATSSTALILIGISGATGLTAVMMDKNKREGALAERRALEAERIALRELLEGEAGLLRQLAAVPVGSIDATQLVATIQVKRERLEEVAALLEREIPQPATSKGWITDLLSDENGVSLHRLQMAVWTVVLGGAFVTAVWRTFAMPVFDETTLGLMGISSSTYLGFKFPERPS